MKDRAEGGMAALRAKTFLPEYEHVSGETPYSQGLWYGPSSGGTVQEID